MNIEKFTEKFFTCLKKMEMPAVKVQPIKADNSLFVITTSDDSQFLIKVGKCGTEEETHFCNKEKMGGRIHEIFEKYTNSREYNHALMQNNIDIDWLIGKLEREDYRILENYILEYGSRNDEIIFQLGFKYAWSLFSECAENKD